jgi:hypothetical protein
MQYSNGSLIDWSGTTGITICQKPGCPTVTGPHQSMSEAKEATRKHWMADHNHEHIVPRDDLGFDPDKCEWDERPCEDTAGASGYCRRHALTLYKRKSRSR